MAPGAVGLGWIGFVHTPESVPVSTVGVCYMPYPVFTLSIGWLLYRDPPTKRAIGGWLMAIAAAFIASSPAAVEPRHLPAMLISPSAPLTFGLAINTLIHRLAPLKALQRAGAFACGATLSLLPLLLTSAPGEVFPQDVNGG